VTCTTTAKTVRSAVVTLRRAGDLETKGVVNRLFKPLELWQAQCGGGHQPVVA
jgi:hypothetical protein